LNPSDPTAATVGTTIQPPNTPGAYTLYLCAIDNAGNVGVNQGTYNFDNVPPIVTQSPNPAVPSSGTYSESPTITITGNDPGTLGVDSSGLSGVRFRWDISFNSDADTSGNTANATQGPNWQANNTTTTIPNVGTRTLYYQSLDNAGNVSPVQSVTYSLDTEAPTLQTLFTNPGTPGNNGWIRSAPTYQITAHDSIGGTQDDTRVASIITDLLQGEVDPNYLNVTPGSDANNLINSPSPTTQTTNFNTGDPVPRFVTLNPGPLTGTPPIPPGTPPGIPSNGIYTAYYYATNTTPLNSIIGSTTFMVDSNAPTATLTSLIQAENLNSVTLSYSMTDDYFDSNLGTNLPSNQTSGLFACDLQESVAVFDSSGVLGDFSDWNTVLSNCGLVSTGPGTGPDPANGPNTQVFNQTHTRTLESGRVYQYQLNLQDNAGNSSQILLSDNVVSNTPPKLSIFNLSQNQSAFPNTTISITGTISDPDMGETIIVSADIGGVTKSQSFQSPLSNQGFTLSWLGSEIPTGIYGNDPNSLEPIVIRVTDTNISTSEVINEVNVTYQGRIISRPTPEQAINNQEIKDLYNNTYTTQAGSLFFLQGTEPNLKDRLTGNLTSTNPNANDFYCFADTGCFSLSINNSSQIWYKDILDTSTIPPTTRTYPFLIQFYEQPFGLDELNIIDAAF
jgi:hypothetical protein